MQATINNLRPGVVQHKANQETVKKIYQILDEEFDLQLGKIVIALSSREELKSMMMRDDPPYLAKYWEEILECFDSNCTRIQTIFNDFGKLSIYHYFLGGPTKLSFTSNVIVVSLLPNLIIQIPAMR